MINISPVRRPALEVPLLLFLLASSASMCLNNNPDSSPKRHFYVDRQELPLVIETSERTSHQLVSHILKILLQEVVGYAKVQINSSYNTMNADNILQRLGGCTDIYCSGESINRVPETMVNLEIWYQSGFQSGHYFEKGHVVDAGPLGPSGRFGWFMPTFSVENNWKDNRSIIDHWRALKLKQVTAQFSLADELDFIERVLARFDPTEDAPSCVADECHSKRHSKRCSSRDNCALLLSSYPEFDMGTLSNQIQMLGLNVSVAWIGSHLRTFVRDRTAKNLPTLFFSWEPDVLTAMDNYTRVKFPLCPSSNGASSDCDFELHQLSKAVWNQVARQAPHAYHVIQRLSFTQEQYENLLRFFIANTDPSDMGREKFDTAACEWLKKNIDIWARWIPDNLDDKTRIYLGGMFPITGPFWRQPGIVPGALLAQDLINKDSSVLPDYDLHILIDDTQCKSDVVMRQFMKYMVNNTHPVAGIIGPGCSDTAEPMVGVAKHFQTVIVSYGAVSDALSNRHQYPYFFRTVPQSSKHGEILGELFDLYGWRQVALLAVDGQDFGEYNSNLHDYFHSRGITVTMDRKIPKLLNFNDAERYVEEIRQKKVHIIIMTSFQNSAQAVLCQAFRKGMTHHKGYQWILPSWFTSDWWDVDRILYSYQQNSQQKEVLPCASRELLTAIDGHMSLANAFYAPEDVVVIGNMTINTWKDEYYAYLPSWAAPSDFATYAYDAVWTFGIALDKLLKEDASALNNLHTFSTTQRLMFHLNATSFMGASGPIRFIGANRVGIIDLTQFQVNQSVVIGRYQQEGAPLSANGTSRLVIFPQLVRWLAPGGVPPDDGGDDDASCSVEAFRAALGVDCDMAILVINVMGVGLFAFCMLLCLIIVKKRYDRKVSATRARMVELGLLDTSWLSLDQWEMPRDHVVLNRKLGEGAFGTVYGGEALVNDIWVAVAVKTLKPGSNAEEKLDFLGEAEMMKRFNHENIVKLLGVCTRGEPAYAIMEFMLHGDLKTYLLSRRHLIGKPFSEAETVSPTKLTQMALDVARGLEYLTDLNYVHRDLACRNCLVHENNSVKIGDFGMTRPMYDSDYYRFSKKGMMPVRWMAPESLADGLFTPATDIWSYGVLLYEIITFGSFPYQGLSNKQVLQYVRMGNSLDLPPMCHTKLKLFISSCWAFRPSERPTVCHLIDALEKERDLLVPCADAPVAPIDLGVSETMDIESPPHKMSRMRTSSRTFSDHCSNTSHASVGRTLSQENYKVLQQSPEHSRMSDPFISLLQHFMPDDSSKAQLSQSSCHNCDNEVEEAEVEEGEEERVEDAEESSRTDHCAKCGEPPSEPGGKPCCRISGETLSSECGSPGKHNYHKFVSLSSSCDDRTDSDYCSDNSREILHANNHTVV